MPVGDDTVAYRRNLPHLEKAGRVYSVTFGTYVRRLLPNAARDIALASILHDNLQFFWLYAAVVMPDHVHVLLVPLEKRLSFIMQRIKSASSHLIVRSTSMRAPVWQDENFDHILRKEEDIWKAADYICMNPVRKGLVSTPDEWPWLWRWWVEGERAGEAPAATL